MSLKWLIILAGFATFVVLKGSVNAGPNVAENFAIDPVLNGRFIQQTHRHGIFLHLQCLESKSDGGS